MRDVRELSHGYGLERTILPDFSLRPTLLTPLYYRAEVDRGDHWAHVCQAFEPWYARPSTALEASRTFNAVTGAAIVASLNPAAADPSMDYTHPYVVPWPAVELILSLDPSAQWTVPSTVAGDQATYTAGGMLTTSPLPQGWAVTIDGTWQDWWGTDVLTTVRGVALSNTIRVVYKGFTPFKGVLERTPIRTRLVNGMGTAGLLAVASFPSFSITMRFAAALTTARRATVSLRCVPWEEFLDDPFYAG